MKQIILYQTRDGQQFPTADEAIAHEAEHPETVLVGLTAEEIGRALVGQEPDIAEALEKVGTRIARERREAGNLKRVRKPDSGNATAAASEQPVSTYERGRGARDFHAGIGGIVPDDLRDTPDAERWLREWDEASVEARQRSAA